MKKTVFIGGIYPECKIEEIIERFGTLPQAAADALQKSIISGLEENLNASVTVFNSYFIPLSFNCFRKEPSYTWQGRYGENYNLSFTKNRILAFNSKTKSVVKSVSEWLKKNTVDGEEVNVIVYPAYFPFMKAISILKKKFNLNVCLAVPDLPQFMGLNSNRSLYNRLSARYSSDALKKYLKCADSFVLLTEAMNEKINLYNKPYCVIEGIIPSDYVFTGKTEENKIKNIVYSGNLQLKYGIENLLKAAKLIDNPNVRFSFYGEGEGADKVKSYSVSDNRIKFCGSIAPSKLHKIHQNAEMLVNPRQDFEEFTKYSFPSKNLEYLMSARPVVAYNLSGMPSEYLDYIFVPNGKTVEDLANCIKEVLNLSNERKNDFGKKSRDFVTEKKNPKAQTSKILKLLK